MSPAALAALRALRDVRVVRADNLGNGYAELHDAGLAWPKYLYEPKGKADYRLTGDGIEAAQKLE